jgi:penicillin-binding protein 1B
VWIGYDDNTPTGLTGSSGSLPVWARLMRSIGTTSLSAPLPEGLEDVSIEFKTGLAADQRCGGEELIMVAVPSGTQLPAKPGCESGVFSGLGERAREWWRGIVR